MFAVTTYDEIEQVEKKVENNELVVLLFVRPTDTSIIQEFEYIHHNSGKYCSIYAIGYTDDASRQNNKDYKQVSVSIEKDWYFSTKNFTEFKNKLEDRIKWRYSGESELLILQNNPGKPNVLNFQNYVTININKGLREGYIDSFQGFMESLIRSAKSAVTAKDVLHDLRKSRISIKDIIAETVDDCKKVPTPIRKIMKDRLFYRSASNISNSI